MKLGLLLTDLARYQEARAALVRASNLEGKEDPFYLTWIGDTYRLEGDGIAAENWYRRAIASDPKNCHGYYSMGRLLLHRGCFSDAMAWLRAATDCEDASAEAWYLRGIAHRAREEYYEAAKCFGEVLALEPKDSAAREGLADVRCIFARSEWERPQCLWGDAYEWMKQRWHEKRPASNVLLAQEYLAGEHDNSAVWFQLGRELIRVHRYAEAREALYTGIELRNEEGWPSFYGAYQMGALYRSMRQMEDADRWYLRAIRENSEDAGPWIFRGALLAIWGRFEEAKESHRRGTLCMKGCRDEAWLNLGFILRAEERFEESADCFRRALAIDPGYDLAEAGLIDVVAARAWERQGDRLGKC